MRTIAESSTKVTQQNAANAEESASASEELSAQAEQMNSIVQELVNLVSAELQQINRATSKRKLTKQQ